MFGSLPQLVSFLPQPKPVQARKIVSTEQWGLTTGTAFRNVIDAGRQHELLANAEIDPAALEEGGDKAAGDAEDGAEWSESEEAFGEGTEDE